MSTLPSPIPGLIWHDLRTLELKEALIDEIVQLLGRIEHHDQLSFRTVETDLNLVYRADQPWRATIARDREGKIVAYAQIRLYRGEVRCWGGVDPHYRALGIGKAILAWVKEQAPTIASSALVRFVIEKDQRDFSDILLQTGFTPAGLIQDMHRDLSQPIGKTTVEFPLSLQPWSPEYDELLRRSTNRLLRSADSPVLGEEEKLFSLGEWEETREYVSPECSFIILDKSTDRWEIAGYSFASIYKQDWQNQQTKQGYLDMFVVFPQWAESNCAMALMNTTLQALKAAGMNSVASSLYQGSDKAMEEIYLQTGFSYSGQNSEYVLEVGQSQECNPE